MITIDFSGINLNLQQTQGKTQVFDPVRKKWIVLTPEEHVRQYIVAYLIAILRYPAAVIAVEKKIMVHTRAKRFDIVIYNNITHDPWMLIECKAPEVPIDATTLHQLLQYQQTIRCRYWVLTNGRQLFCADAADPEKIVWLQSLPAYQF